jgi:phenylalanyl-tRNA synthetase beta chain
MLISTNWLCSFLTRGPLPEDEIRHALIDSGFPIESVAALPGGDTRLDVEITSNRGDCLSHLGLAREVAASLAIPLRSPFGQTPDMPLDSESASSLLTMHNTVPHACPRFTARVIRGVKVGPSPDWLKAALEAVGQRSINNVVDVTNYINFELGHPCHAFDLAKLDGAKIVVRLAHTGERLTTLDGKSRTLVGDEIVVADATRAQGLAGIIGGGESEVSASTTDVVLEVATWDPVTVRKAARRHQVRTDASHRYERYVDARCVDQAATRAAALIAQVSGGRVCTGALEAGLPLAPLTSITLRPHRCCELLGSPITDAEMIHLLTALEVAVVRDGATLRCTIPPFRPDLVREIDLIEEVGRLHGLEKIPTQPTMNIVAKPPQTSELARRELSSLLVGMGFFEAVTFSFTSPKEAAMFLPPKLDTVSVDDDRRKEEPTLRPSALTGLLACRRGNQHAQSAPPGEVRLFEVAASFAQHANPDPKSPPITIEHTNVALLMDVLVKGKSASIGELQTGVRALRGVIESLVRNLAGTGPGAPELVIQPTTPHAPAFDPRAYATVSLTGEALGYVGLISASTQAHYDLSTPQVAAELSVARLTRHYPPVASVTTLPAFPGIERDLSLIVDERVTWENVSAQIALAKAARPADRLDAWNFVATYRGQQIGKGLKSMTVRLAFRDATRTLRHEEVDGPMSAIVGDLQKAVGATLRV